MLSGHVGCERTFELAMEVWRMGAVLARGEHVYIVIEFVDL